MRKTLDASNEAIERAKLSLVNASKAGNAETIRNLEAAQQAIREVVATQERVSKQLDLVSAVGAELQKQTSLLEGQKAILEEQAAKLQKDKTDLERRELVWSTSFLAALLAALVALASALVKYPIMRLDAQLKRIEIKERELALRKLESESKTEP